MEAAVMAVHIITTTAEITTVAKAVIDRICLRGLATESLPGKDLFHRLQRIDLIH